METGEQLLENPHHSLSKVASCPVALCQASPTCKAAVAEERARGDTLKPGTMADGATGTYWKVMRKKTLSENRKKRKEMDEATAKEQLHDLG